MTVPCRQPLACRRGAALMLVLWIIAILGTIATGVVMTTRSTIGVASNYRARVVARYAAESGVSVAVSTLQSRMAELGDTPARRDYLNLLDSALGNEAQVALGDARLAIALVDIGARLDVNAADEASLVTLFSTFTDPLQAERAASAIRASPALRSLDELDRIPAVGRELAEKAVPYLTVDGDGTINRLTASDTVLAAAGGELRDEPSRILVVSRGWQDGHPLTHEIQAVYALVGNELVLVRWRERDL
jgi:type II secretory pathway component PulK